LLRKIEEVFYGLRSMRAKETEEENKKEEVSFNMGGQDYLFIKK